MALAEQQSWHEFWAGGEGDEAVGGVQRHRLAARWAQFFLGPRPARPRPLVIDIAAGRGVALRAAIEALDGTADFLAVDYSPAAAASARRGLGSAFAAAADAARLPLTDHCAAYVISQYGIEYAGGGAFAEAARILAPGGRFCAVAHFRGGAIDAECAENERLLLAAAGPALFDAARRALAESFARRAGGAAERADASLENAFSAAMTAALAALRPAPPSAARSTLERFLADLSRLSARRLAYEDSDALGWVSGMEASLGAYLKRMQSMRGAALDAGGIADIAGHFAAAGLGDFSATPLHLDGGRPPAAWVIEARRPDTV